MSYFLSPINSQIVDANGNPLSGGKIYTYQAGTTTATATYTDSTGGTPQANPIILNSLGVPASPIWLNGGTTYKFVIKNSAEVTQRTIDGITGVNDISTSASEWNESGFVPTYISATQFSVPGDQTLTLHVNRRVRTRNTGGYVYGRISVSAYGGSVTTVTVVNDSSSMDSGLSSVAYGFLSFTPASIPYAMYAAAGANSDITSLSGLTSPITLVAPRSYLTGCTMSTAGSSATMSIAAGQAVDSTNAALLNVAAIAKTTSAWAVGSGNGGLDTGSIANSTGYHFYAIRRPDTGVVDVIFSTSASTPTLPANYTQYRRIGWGKTNGTALWTKFIQDGDLFLWDVAVLDVDVTPPATTAITRTLSVPTGINVLAKFNAASYDAANANQISALFTDLAITDAAPSRTSAPLAMVTGSANGYAGGFGTFTVRTNTSAQIRSRVDIISATSALKIATTGWIDRRGRES